MLDPDIPKWLPQQPVVSVLGIKPTEKEVATAMKAMTNAKAVGPDGLPAELLKLGLQQDLQQLPDGMRACVRPDDGVCSDWFKVELGLRQGRVLSPLLFNIFFVVMLTVIIHRFSENPAILAELVHLKKPSISMGPEPVMD